MFDFAMPSLGADMDAGTVVAWHVRPGDAVRRGQVIVDVETAKGIVEVEIWRAGIVRELRVAPGTKVPVGTVLATLDEAAVASKPAATAPSPEPARAIAPANVPPSVQPAHDIAPPTRPEPVAARVQPAHDIAPPIRPEPVVARVQPVHDIAPPAAERSVDLDRPRASPAARKRARELDVDLHMLHGTGHHGAISILDVERAATPQRPAPVHIEPTTVLPMDRTSAMRQAIAAAMAKSKREIPHYYLTSDIDMARALAWLQTENAARPITERLLVAALQLKAVALALRRVPQLNGYWIDGAFRPSAGIHVGVAISLRGGGLVAPALHDTDTLSVADLMRGLVDLTNRARGGTLRSSELTDATITVTNLGEQGAESVLGVIYPPQVALVGFGRVVERPWAVDGMLGVRPIVRASLAADHRASDGHLGGRLLTTIDTLLQHPEQL